MPVCSFLLDLSPSPLTGEGWGEGEAPRPVAQILGHLLPPRGKENADALDLHVSVAGLRQLPIKQLRSDHIAQDLSSPPAEREHSPIADHALQR